MQLPYQGLKLFYSRRWSNHLVHLIYGNWLSCKRMNKVSPLLPHQSAKLDCGFLLEKVCFSFSVQATVLSCVSWGTSHVPESSRGKQGAHILLPFPPEASVWSAATGKPVYTILQFIKDAIALCLEKSTYLKSILYKKYIPLPLKNVLLLKNANCPLSLSHSNNIKDH